MPTSPLTSNPTLAKVVATRPIALVKLICALPISTQLKYIKEPTSLPVYRFKCDKIRVNYLGNCLTSAQLTALSIELIDIF